MGNAGLCSGDGGGGDWPPAAVTTDGPARAAAPDNLTDIRLLRLWAEVFRVQDNDFEWEKLSDDVVQVSISRALDGRPKRELRIEARGSRRSPPVLEAKVVQFATTLVQASECFVHWQDEARNCSFGLNFTAARDAQRFLACFSPEPADRALGVGDNWRGDDKPGGAEGPRQQRKKMPATDPLDIRCVCDPPAMSARAVAATTTSSNGQGRGGKQRLRGGSSAQGRLSWQLIPDPAPSKLQTSGGGGGGCEMNSSCGECCCQPAGAISNSYYAVGKSGWLSVKCWLVRKRQRLQLAERRRWRSHWASLRGSMLLLYKSEPGGDTRNGGGGGGERRGGGGKSGAPQECLVIDGCIAQAMPEHPKRDCVLALSTAQGDAFMIQAPSTQEMDSWIRALHAACAVQLARRATEPDPLELLKTEIARLESSQDCMDGKVHRMASLRVSSTGISSRDLLDQWEEEAEAQSVHLYRLRCYLASLLGKEVPNPMATLSSASKATKHSLGRLGQFSVTSFHALIVARGGGGDGSETGGIRPPRARFQSGQTVRSSASDTAASDSGGRARGDGGPLEGRQTEFTCRLQKRPGSRQFGITVEAELRRCYDNEEGRELCLMVTGVESRSAADTAGLEVGDEVLTVDGRRVARLSMTEVERMFDISDGLSLRLLRRTESAAGGCRIRSRTLSRSVSTAATAAACDTGSLGRVGGAAGERGAGGSRTPAVPELRRQANVASSRSSDSASIQNANSLASWSNRSDSPSVASARSAAEVAAALRAALAELLRTERDQAEQLLDLQGICQQLLRGAAPSVEAAGSGCGCQRQADMAQLAAAARLMAEFHARFLSPVSEVAAASVAGGDSVAVGGIPSRDFKTILLTVAGTFLQHDNELNMYCQFCLCGMKCAKVLNQELIASQCLPEVNGRSGTPAMAEGGSVASWDRLLMRPLERIGSYRSLLEALRGCARVGSEEQAQLAKALQNLRLLADRVGTLRALDREFRAKFDELACLHVQQHPDKPAVNLSLDQLLLYGSVDWHSASYLDGVGNLNGSDAADWNGGSEDSGMWTGCFVFASAVALVQQRRQDGAVLSQAVVPIGEAHAAPGAEARQTAATEPGGRWFWVLRWHASSGPHSDDDYGERQFVNRVFRLSCRSQQAQSDFLRAINEAAARSSATAALVPAAAAAYSTILHHRTAARRPRPDPPRRSSSQPAQREGSSCTPAGAR